VVAGRVSLAPNARRHLFGYDQDRNPLRCGESVVNIEVFSAIFT
jgi:hypothetical protein